MQRNHNYKFLTFDEQIKHLEKDRGLIITDRDKLKEYLSIYNYEDFVNNHSKFLVYENRKFIKGVTDKTIISIFEFDREISNLIFKDVLKVERMINTKVVYVISRYYQNIIPSIKNGKILGLKEEEFRLIFKHPIKTKDGGKRFIQEKDLTEYAPKELLNNNPSLWKLALHWSAGTLKNVYDSLDVQVKREIITELNLKYKIDSSTFLNVIGLLNKLRNRICHHNMLYLLDYFAKETYPFSLKELYKSIFNLEIKKVRLFNALKIIELFINTNVINEINNALSTLKLDIGMSMKSKVNADEIFWKIKCFMRF